jgi:hypothetical protein
MLGSAGVAVDPWDGPLATLAQPLGAPMGAAKGPAGDAELAWQTSIGQFIFLQSVVHERT